MFSVEHLNRLRLAEMDVVAPLLAQAHRVLEVGAGTGQQARHLVDLGHTVEAIDLPASTYSGHQVFPVRPYDGRTLPGESASFDAVYSSNLLEHVRDLPGMHRETRRVLRPDGIAVHVVPTHVWRAWTTATAWPDATVQAISALIPPHHWMGSLRGVVGTLLPRRHGERGNIISETWLYHPVEWRKHFRSNGFRVIAEVPIGYFYTGNMLLGKRLGLEHRRTLARWFGSACHAFVLSARRNADG